ncbi:hypothetical protein BU24DRAFT_473015 [Aaosphaeria arxii CBS 175.79]|uniref:C2H2-type domain-containing protein n=1 Tax=Aaosphaeria arxii CBS 175.79 TaxID=1450172 RepID=A0A6A5X9W4_9PLEO|nr:uncharacterized protein BU24DRAFT_473015 [Aaosphaeria arxii CBS 175.79]KAF2009845.1 hypothetical protein BU24DRAFT_473015 [Aaosphaeria arxii CBS 175.79]
MSERNEDFQGFDFNVPYYDAPLLANESLLPAWPPHNSQECQVKAVPPAAPSPAVSIQTVRSAPQANSPFLRFEEPSPLQFQHVRADSNLSDTCSLNFLQVQQQSSTLPGQRRDASSLDRFWIEVPWNPMNTRNFSRPSSDSNSLQRNMYHDLGMCPSGPSSEAESSARMGDSGYGTASYSSPSDQGRSHDIPSDAVYTLPRRNVGSTVAEEPNNVFVFNNNSKVDRLSQYSGRSRARSAISGRKYHCVICQEVSKCQSDHKKHMLRHNKPFKCNLANCKRGGKGFGTINDLTRHKKSVHGIQVLENSYRCASNACRNKEKVWPRLDNFKQHIQRMHAEENEQDVIRRSAIGLQAVLPDRSMPPMDATLAGIGTERQCFSNDVNHPTSGISLTPSQEPNPWIVSDLSLTRLSLRVVNDEGFDPYQPEISIELDQAERSKTVAPNGSGHRVLDSTDRSKVAGPCLYDSSSLDSTSSQFPWNHLEECKVFENLRTLSRSRPPETEEQHEQLRHVHKFLQNTKESNFLGDREDTENLDIVLSFPKKMGRHGEALPERADSVVSSISTDATCVGNDRDVKFTTISKSHLIQLAQAVSEKVNQIKCPTCHVPLRGLPDLEEHLKQHKNLPPHACVVPSCDARFETFQAWKSHEEKEHSYPELYFRCKRLQLPTQSSCQDMFQSEDGFKEHLKKVHDILDDDDRESEARACKLEYWCGFCSEFQKTSARRSTGRYQERLCHIQKHVDEEKMVLEDWKRIADEATGDELDHLQATVEASETIDDDDAMSVPPALPGWEDQSEIGPSRECYVDADMLDLDGDTSIYFQHQPERPRRGGFGE